MRKYPLTLLRFLLGVVCLTFVAVWAATAAFAAPAFSNQTAPIHKPVTSPESQWFTLHLSTEVDPHALRMSLNQWQHEGIVTAIELTEQGQWLVQAPQTAVSQLLRLAGVRAVSATPPKVVASLAVQGEVTDNNNLTQQWLVLDPAYQDTRTLIHLQNELAQLQAEGIIIDFTLTPDMQVVTIATDTDVPDQLRQLPGVLDLSALPSTVFSAQTEQRQNIPNGGQISGLLTSESTQDPLPDITVYFYRYEAWWQMVHTTTTTINGTYDSGNLLPGLYRLYFRDATRNYLPEYYDNAPYFDSATQITVNEGGTNTADAALTPAGHIRGTVTAPDGVTPVDNISVAAYWYDGLYWQWRSYSQTDSNGQYDVGGLTIGQHVLFFSDQNGRYLAEYYDNANSLDTGTPIPLTTVGEVVDGIDLSLTLAGHISGKVTAADGTTPLEGVTVSAYRQEQTWWSWAGYVQTNESGFYDLGGLITDTYRVFFQDWQGSYLSEYYDDADSIDDAADIAVVAGQTVTDINAALTEGGHITGTVTGSDTNLPLTDIVARAHRVVNGQIIGWGYVGLTDEQGQYDVKGLETGHYKVVFYDLLDVYLTEFYDDADNIEAAMLISVTATLTTGSIDAALGALGAN